MRISRNCFDSILPVSFILIIIFTSGILRGLNLFLANTGFAIMGLITLCVLYISIFYIAYSHGIRNNINLIKPILPMLIMCGVMITFGTYESINKKATVIGMTYLISFILFCSVISDYYNDKKIFEMITKGFLIVVIMNLFFIIIFPQHSFDSVDGRFRASLMGMFFHKNSLACFMCLGNIVMLINLIDKNNEGTDKRLYIFVYILTIIFILLANSSTSLLMLIICNAIIIAYKRIKLRLNVINWLVGFHILLYTVILQSEFINDLMVSLIGRDLTLTGRVDIWKLLISIIKQKPWMGYGYDAIWNTPEMVYYIYSKFTFEFVGSHNGPIHLLLEFGIIGFAAFFIIFLLIPSTKLRNLDLENNNLHMFSYIYFAYILIYSIAESTFLPNHFQTLFLIISVLCVMSSGKRKSYGENNN